MALLFSGDKPKRNKSLNLYSQKTIRAPIENISVAFILSLTGITDDSMLSKLFFI
jgi:hypothetical protein